METDNIRISPDIYGYGRI